MHLWDDVEGYFKFEYEKYAYIEDSSGEYQTLNGKKVSKIHEWDNHMINSGMLHEHDIHPEVRTLVDLYSDSDEMSNDHCIMCFDIEVAKDKKHSTAKDANNTITSIAAHDTKTNRTHVWILNYDPDRECGTYEDGDRTITILNSEIDLLKSFIAYYSHIQPTILTGWNIIGYDLPYLYNRLEKLFGRYSGNWLSQIKRVQYYENKLGKVVFKIGGTAVLDYMELYKIFTYTELPNYTLEAVSMFELGRGKVKYDGSLDDLYKSDFSKFIDYNITDVRLVLDLDLKLDFISIARGICHKGHVPYDDVYSTMRYMEGACITEARRKERVVDARLHGGDGEKGIGAFVKIPRPGKYSWVYDLDLTSLYPSNIMSLNISPETKWGTILNWDSSDFVSCVDKEYEIQIFDTYGGGEDRVGSKDIRKFLEINKLAVAANGILYKQDIEGLLPTILMKWFDERARFRKLATESYEKGNIEDHNTWDRKQKIQKVLLNSLYGVLLQPAFRFYDKDNGEAVTVTGQQVIKYTTTMINHVYNTECKTDGIDYCVYSDTDSVFFESLPLLNVRHKNLDEANIPDLTIGVATEIQNFVNACYDIYGYEFHNIDKHKWKIKQEYVAKRAFWGNKKKRYAMWLVREGSKVIDKIDIKGFDSVRSDFPKVFRSVLENVIVDVLKDKTCAQIQGDLSQFKQEFDSMPMMTIMKPTGVNNLDTYTPRDTEKFKPHTPVHVKAAINHNRLLKKIGNPSVAPIYTGDKILWTYVKKNKYLYEEIAIKGYDDDPLIVAFVEENIYRDKLFDSYFVTKVQSIWDSLGWGALKLNLNVLKLLSYD